MAVPLALHEQLAWANLPISLFIGGAITAIIGLMIYLIELITGQIQNGLTKRRSTIIIVLVIASAGAVRGILFFKFVEWSDFLQPLGILQRVSVSTLTTLFWLTSITYVVQESESFRFRFETYFKDEIIRRSQIQPSSAMRLTPEMRISFKEIEVSLAKALSHTTGSTINRESLMLAAVTVRQTIEEKIRPLSHRLWLKNSDLTPKARLTATVIVGLRFLDVPPFMISNMVGLICLMNLPHSVGLIRGLVGGLTAYLISFCFFWYYQKFLIHQFYNKIYLNLFFLLIPSFLTSLIIYLTNYFIYKNNYGPVNLIFMIIILILTILISAFQASRRDKDRILEIILSDLNDSQSSISESSASENEQLASFLHNSLQSELRALSFQLEESAKNPDSNETKALLERLGSRIDRSISNDYENFFHSPLDRIKKLESAWRGIAKVEIKFLTPIPIDPPHFHLVAQIIEESISNAVRFSGSTTVVVDVDQTDTGALNLTISANGVAGPQNPAGLGTEWLDRYATGKWSRTFLQSGSVLKLTL